MGSHCSQGSRIRSIQRREYDLTGGASGAASQPERPAEGVCEMIPDPSIRGRIG